MIHTAEGRFMKKETMGFLEQHLPADQFIRIHRSHIVQIKHIKKMNNTVAKLYDYPVKRQSGKPQQKPY